MNKKKQNERKNPPSPNKTKLSLKGWRILVSKTTNIELDLDNRQILLNGKDLSSLQLDINSNNLDGFISEYVDPEQSQSVINSLKEAGMGIEKPIQFCFVHPAVSQKFCFEYRYHIAYVSYAKTRLKGELVSLNRRKRK